VVLVASVLVFDLGIFAGVDGLSVDGMGVVVVVDALRDVIDAVVDTLDVIVVVDGLGVAGGV
jgi:hypothetical protein